MIADKPLPTKRQTLELELKRAEARYEKAVLDEMASRRAACDALAYRRKAAAFYRAAQAALASHGDEP